ncbi:acyl-CoA thioesterase [Streptomyces chartreusis]|uniref:Acyl-CoA thioesterase n=1 Tax=Streptomyces chartreusis TaxID=1969 RepID=A0A7H8TBU8_STRCX|nr:thioesterase family protein [Streptomyces chartreusis]QKZ20834.1 acyl-CoA thioesterase [Streptomyces chartreusis]
MTSVSGPAFRHRYRCSIRWSDMDVFGHVNNSVFLTYLEDARIDLLARRACRAGVATFVEGCVVVRHEIDYKLPVEWRSGAVTVEVRVAEIKDVSFNLAYEVKNDRNLYAKANSIIVPYSLQDKSPRRLTEAERSFLARFKVNPVNERFGSGSASPEGH